MINLRVDDLDGFVAQRSGLDVLGSTDEGWWQIRSATGP
jgi:hypothetical protein